MRGRLVLVVGPSGAGKDTLISAAKAALADDRRYVFPRRVVTRTASKELEDHESVTMEAFDSLEAAGAFALTWRAHGLAYGIPANLGVALEAGRIVVLNVSRAIVAEARARFPGTAVLLVDAAAALRAERLAARGRETAEAIAARIGREVPSAGETIVIDNSGSLENGVAGFLEALRGLAAE